MNNIYLFVSFSCVENFEFLFVYTRFIPIFIFFYLVFVNCSHIGRCSAMKKMGKDTESKIMDHASVSKKLHNLIFSVNFCGLCFENGGENNIEHEVETASYDYRSYISLGEMYTIVFHEVSPP